MEATNATTGAEPDASEVIAGPGQKPARPHPAPNSAEPASRRASTLLLLGIEKVAARIGDRIVRLSR